jgi:hypothetical protein
VTLDELHAVDGFERLARVVWPRPFRRSPASAGRLSDVCPASAGRLVHGVRLRPNDDTVLCDARRSPEVVQKNHATARSSGWGFYKVGQESRALPGPNRWTSAVRRLDRRHPQDHRRGDYKIRFTPRKKTSTWSGVNIRRVKVLADEKRMQPAG